MNRGLGSVMLYNYSTACGTDVHLYTYISQTHYPS